MKKYFIIAFVIFSALQMKAQSLTSKKYTVSITDIKTDNKTVNMGGGMIKHLNYEGYYTIVKDGKELIKQRFTAWQYTYNGVLVLNVNIKIFGEQGNTTSYSYDTKKINYHTKKNVKPKKSGTIKELILSSILVYAQVTYDQKEP
jgi:hypothetical protein